MHDQIATYIKTDTRSIMLHKGYGSDKKRAITSLLILGRKMLKDGNLKLSETLFLKALELAPNIKLKVYIRSLLIDVYYFSGKYTEANKIHSKALDIISESLPISRLLVAKLHAKAVAVYIQQGKQDKAINTIELALDFIKNRTNISIYPILLNHKAHIYYKQALTQTEKLKEKLLRAKFLYEESEQLECELKTSNLARVTNNDIGIVYKALGDLNIAKSKMEKKLERVKDKANIFIVLNTLMALADICRMAGDYSGAKEYINSVMTLAKNTMTGRWLMYSHNILASIYHDTNEYDRALEEDNRCLAASLCLEKGFEYNSVTSQIFVQMGHTYKEKGNLDKAILHFTAATGRQTTNKHLMSAYEGLAEVYFCKEDFDKEFECLDKAESLLNSFHENIKLYYKFNINRLRAHTFVKQGHVDQALTLVPILKTLAVNNKVMQNEVKELEDLCR